MVNVVVNTVVNATGVWLLCFRRFSEASMAEVEWEQGKMRTTEGFRSCRAIKAIGYLPP